MVRYFLLSLVFILVSTAAMAQTSLQGKVSDKDTGEDLFGANIVLTQNGVFAAGVSADLDGNYSVMVDPGTYDVEVSYLGLPSKKVTGVIVKAGQANKLDVDLGGDDGTGIDLDVVIVTEYKVPLIEQDNTTSGKVITGEDIRNLPTKDVTALAATAAGISQADEGDALTVRGSRDNATDYYIDGIRVRGSSSLIPQSEIDQLQVITGGIEAQYGDVTGGIISLTTKGPSSRFSGGIDVETSEQLDPYGYNLASGYLSGPILRKPTGESILGFRVSAQYRTRKDDDPPAVDVFRIKEDKLAELEANPITTIGSTNIPSAEFLTNDDVEVLDYQPYERDRRLDLTAKIDARINPAIDITFSGAYSREEDQFTPGEGNQTGANWRLLNAQNNPSDVDTRYRGNFRFRHRLGNSGYNAEGSDKTSSLIQNAQYTLNFGYETRKYDLSDPTHQDNFFGYGHVGTFDYEWQPFFGFGSDWSGAPFTFGHLDNQQTFLGYSANGSSNPGLAAYNNNPDAGAITDFAAQNGQFVGNVQEAWNFHTNINQVYNLFRKRNNDLYTLNVMSSFDLVPKSSDKGGRHSIQFGIIYEQRVNRGYDLFPRELWNVARLQANRHILGVDTSNVVGYISPPPPPGNQLPGVDSIAIFGTQFTTPDELLFYQRVRQQTGQGLGEYVNVDGINPNDLSLSMFSPQELTDQDLVRYWGYDYLGNEVSTDVTFDDFFKETDENGVRTLPVAAFQPIYSAAYIQDKFTFKDVIFRLGLRVDRYDANTKVLKDIYSLYDVQNASDFYNNNPGLARPPAVQDDFKVYVDEPGSTSVKAFRTGEQWFFEDGNPANDGNIIFGGQVVTPVLREEGSDIKQLGYNVDNSFEDYEPQVNWMPRLAFSFPISDAANFFAHYDVLVQRPASNTQVSALEYFYFNERTPLNNPNLRPSRTIDYEVGFQQRLSNSSAIKISAYYKEMRDMIQRRTVLFVPSPVITYDTYGNIDFGTVKGFSFQYDMRRTGNVMLNANYTLQFADGTGSDVNSQRGLTNRGNIRTLFPLNFDERHRIVTTIDYRYRSGRQYNGPKLFGKDIFADAGANLQLIAVSGRPYTAKLQPSKLDGASTIGQINGARLPWQYSINLRVDKSFRFGGQGENKRSYGLNIYFRVQNLLDRQNIINVYPATGSATDDGYLESPFGIGEIQNIQTSGRSIDSFIDSYQWRVLNPNFYTLPRRIFLGAIFDF